MEHVIIASNIKYLANMILSAVGVMAAHKQDFQMLGVVDLAAWSTTFLSGSRMWASLGARERSFKPSLFYELSCASANLQDQVVGEWVGFDHSGFQFRVEAAAGG